MSEIKLYAKDWIPITQPPFDEGVYLIVHEPCQCISTARYWKSLGGAPKWTDNITGDKVFEPTHWTHLPGPPPRESSFEQWWSSLKKWGVSTDPGFGNVAVGLAPDRCITYKEEARSVWNAAIDASKRPDFVP